MLALTEDGVADEGAVLVGAEDDAEGEVVVGAACEGSVEWSGLWLR